MSPRGAPKTNPVDDYLARVPPKSRAALQRIRKIVRAAAPNAEEVISYKLPAFRQNGMLVYYGAFADHCSFFVGSALVRHRFAAELKPFESGKGTCRFTPDRPIPAALVTRIVKARLAENASRRSK
ncbi:MAG: DUF1801 domain-containing protein [Thermoplasmata archaeon]|nr:DUF1801 domain-containing protein [Thermoplasmata archaeon]